MDATEKILVVLPAYNEAANLPVVVEELKKAGGGWDLVVIDDGSTDDTCETARGLGLPVLQHPRNLGYGAALKTGYRYALEHDYDVVVQCDADGQHDPALIPRFIEELHAGCDVVFGSRMLTKEGYRPTLPRWVGIHFFAWLGRVTTGQPITDPTTGFAAMSSRAAAFLAEVTPDDYPDLNVLLMLHRAGFVVREVPAVMRHRLSGRSMTGGLVPLVYIPKMLMYLSRIFTSPGETVQPAAEAGDPAARRVLLANPPTGLYIREDRCQTPVKGISASLRFPIDLAYMAASARLQKAIPLVRDYPAEGLGEDAFRDDLKRFQPHVLVLSTISPTLEWDLEYCRLAKHLHPSVLTVVKGAHVTERARQVLESNQAVDVVIRGDCEVAAGEIASGRPLEDIPGLTYQTGRSIRQTQPRPLPSDPDGLPFPARDLTSNQLYFRPDTRKPQTTIQTAWGCPYRCTYCLAPVVSGRKLRSRSPGSVLAEIRQCVEQHDIRDFYFRADTFTLDRKWVFELCDLIDQSGLAVNWGCNSRVDTVDPEMLERMRRAGCWIIGFGVESGSDEILERVRKGATVAQARRAVALCREAGIKAYAFFMVGFPWETEQTVRQTLDLIQDIGADFIEMNMPVPFPGTELAGEVEKQGLMEAPLLGHDHSRPVIRPHAMSRERVRALWREGFIRFYTRPGQIYRLLKDVRSVGDAINYLTWGSRFMLRLMTRRD
jgi:radical SAM superfamily enzyme YgiQ (UPF0313 family)